MHYLCIILQKAKREITLANDRHAELLKTYTSVDKKAGWLERTLKEAEVLLFYFMNKIFQLKDFALNMIRKCRISA